MRADDLKKTKQHVAVAHERTCDGDPEVIHDSHSAFSYFIYQLQCTIPLFINTMYITLQSSTCFKH
jgi:hypothetical protein